MADSLCIPIDDGGGIMPEPADIEPLDGIVPVLLIILPPESIAREVVRECGRGDRMLPSVSLLSFAADDKAYSGSAGGLLLSIMTAVAAAAAATPAPGGVCLLTPGAAPEPLASRRPTLELARRRRDLKRVTNGEAESGGCGE